MSYTEFYCHFPYLMQNTANKRHVQRMAKKCVWQTGYRIRNTERNLATGTGVFIENTGYRDRRTIRDTWLQGHAYI